MSYKLYFTQAAEDDLSEIFGYISQKLASPQAALELMEAMKGKLMRLEKFPNSAPMVNDDILRSRGYRKLAVANYLIFYIVREKTKQVVIMAILYGAQKYEDIL